MLDRPSLTYVSGEGEEHGYQKMTTEGSRLGIPFGLPLPKGTTSKVPGSRSTFFLLSYGPHHLFLRLRVTIRPYEET